MKKNNKDLGFSLSRFFNSDELIKLFFGRRFLWLLLSSFFVNLGLLLTPLFSMLVYDKVVHNGIFETLWGLTVGVVLFLFAELLVRWVRFRHIEQLAFIIDQKIDKKVFETLLSPSERSAAQPGAISRFMTFYRDLSSARDLFSSQYLLALSDVPFILIIWVVISYIAWPLLLVILFWVFLYVSFGLYLKKQSLKVSKKVSHSLALKFSILADAMSSLDTVRTSFAGEFLKRRFFDTAQFNSLETVKLRVCLMQQAHLMQAVYLLSYVTLLVVGSYLVFYQQISTGALIAVSMLNSRCLSVSGQMLATLGRWEELRQAMTSLSPYLNENIEDVTEPSVSVRQSSLELPVLSLQDITHSYKEGKSALNAINLVINSGEKVGLIGRPGSGKSTLLRIMAGAIKPVSGEVMISYSAISSLPNALRFNLIAFKPQEFPLISGSIEDNILLSLAVDTNPDNKLAALKHAIYYSSLDHELALGKLNLDQYVEEYGANLSGGQRQKIALARALAIYPQIILLDEPTSGLDHESEQLIMNRLSELKGVTIIIVTHNRSILSEMDRLVVLENGIILADDKTEKLLI